jgi:deoxyribose-phosphate aldolase
MRKELLLNNPSLEVAEFQDLIFAGISEKVETIVVPSGLVAQARFVYPEYPYSAIIGYPHGITSLELKTHEVIENVRRGVRKFDLVLNEFYLRNLEYKRLLTEYFALKNTCKEYGAELRVVIEHRLLSKERNIKIAELLYTSGLETLFLSTGNMIQNTADAIIICYKIMERADLTIGIYGNLWPPRYEKAFYKAGGKIIRVSTL